MLLLLAAAAQPVEAAERAFASMAQTKGQWTAFRAFAAPDAVMTIDGLQPAAPFLKDHADPPAAVMWWPARTVTSCDGTLAFSTGPWRRDGGRRTGRYFTVWQRGQDGSWQWLFDSGSEDKSGAPAGEKVRSDVASCRGARPVWFSAPPAIGGLSRDGSLRWRFEPVPEFKGRYRLQMLINRHGQLQTFEDTTFDP